MRIAFLYGSFSIGQRPFDFDTLYTNRRGLTGSEISCVEYAQAMAARGHEVTLVVGQPGLNHAWGGLRLLSLENPRDVDGFDAVLSWNEPNLLREVDPKALRVVNQQLNDFAYCRPGWEEWADIVTSPSADHLEYLKKQAPGVKKWEVLPNGCDPTQYKPGKQIPGRVIWASSADRGLHHLLEVWPRIKRAVPHASLRAFYNFTPSHFDDFEATGPNVHPDLLEIAQRKRYIRYAMGRLSGPTWDVEHVGSVSRERMRLEFEHAEVLGYPCDTIRYTEGFSVTTMEACASGCLPVISAVDCLGSLYGGVVPMVNYRPPASYAFGEECLRIFTDLVVRGLTDKAWRDETAEKCRALAERHAWPVLAERLEGMLSSAIAARGKTASAKKQARAEEHVNPG